MNIQALLEFQYGEAFLAEYATVLVLQILLYLTAAGSVAIFYKLVSLTGVGTKIEPRTNYPRQVPTEISWSLGTCGVIAAYFYVAFVFIEETYSQDWVAAAWQVLGFIVVYDFYMYVTHRALHSGWLRKFHARHHTAISATPWSCINMHPVEAVINYLPFLLFAILTPVSLIVLLGIHVYLIFGIANGHSNYSLMPIAKTPFLFRELTTFHQQHHSDGRGNFGYLYTHWDWVFGTRHQ